MAVRTTYGGRFWRLILVVTTLVVFLPVNQQRATAAQDEAAPTLMLVARPGFGSILTDAEGFTLYRWDGDQQGVSNCFDACAVAWPPLLIVDALIAPTNLPGSLGFIDRGEEGWQVTFDNWPLYYFVRDLAPGDVNGEGSMGFGARWSVLAFAAAPPALPAPPIIQQPLPPGAQAPPPAAATSRPAPQPTARPIPPAQPPATAVPAPAAPPAAAAGVEGPQFGNWGPNMAAPDQEGFGGYGPGAPGRADSPYGGAYAAPAPGVAPGVAPYYYPAGYGGCQYDLRGSWLNEGRQTTGGYRPYSSSVYVRQYRQWVHGQQDDGTSYYGQCIGNRLQLDVYRGAQYMGRQSGTVRSRNYGYPVPMYGEPLMPYAAPFAPSPYGNSNIVATFTWTTYYGTGTETWHRNYSYYDSYY